MNEKTLIKLYIQTYYTPIISDMDVIWAEAHIEEQERTPDINELSPRTNEERMFKWAKD